MQREDWVQIFGEVEREIGGLIVQQAEQIIRAFALNAPKLSVSFTVSLEEKDRTFDVGVDIGFVKERVKAGDSRRLVLGQIELPGCGSERPPEPPPRDPFAAVQDGCTYMSVEDRLECVKEMDSEQLRAVLDLRGCQRSVVKAAERRLRKLEKIAVCDPSAAAGGF